jgi:hypothetical protein
MPDVNPATDLRRRSGKTCASHGLTDGQPKLTTDLRRTLMWRRPRPDDTALPPLRAPLQPRHRDSGVTRRLRAHQASRAPRARPRQPRALEGELIRLRRSGKAAQFTDKLQRRCSNFGICGGGLKLCNVFILRHIVILADEYFAVSRAVFVVCVTREAVPGGGVRTRTRVPSQWHCTGSLLEGKRLLRRKRWPGLTARSEFG